MKSLALLSGLTFFVATLVVAEAIHLLRGLYRDLTKGF